MNNFSIKVNNLSFSYNKKPILKNLNFEIERGSFISILGPNGVGKSTLVNLLSKVVVPTSGEIFIEDVNLENLNHLEVAKKIAVVPQYVNLGFNFTVYETILMGRYPYFNRFKVDNKNDFVMVNKAMKITKTDVLKERKYNELSGGERQRVIIAQALAQDAPIIILDEPTSHLDINFQIEFMELFNKLNKEEYKTIIGIFHDINLALQYSDKIMLLKDGSIFCFGNINEIITRSNIMSVFNTDVYVGKNPFTGKLYISPNFNLHILKDEVKNKKDIRIHVIGGGGSASEILNMLHNLDYILSTGVINNLDTDINTSEELGIVFVNEAPFSPISKEAYERNIELIKISDVVILPSIEFGHGNFLNLKAVFEALKIGKKIIIVDDKEIAERDHVGGEAIKLYNEIIAKGAITVKNNHNILEVLKRED